MDGLGIMVEDSPAGPDLTPLAASCVAKSQSCECCSVDSIVQGRTKAKWGTLSVGEPVARCCLGCKTVARNKSVDTFKPVLKNAFQHDTDNALKQWPCLAALDTERVATLVQRASSQLSSLETLLSCTWMWTKLMTADVTRHSTRHSTMTCP